MEQAAVRQMDISLSGMQSRMQGGRAKLKQMLDDCCLIELNRLRPAIDYDLRSTGCHSCQPLSPKAHG